MTTIYEPGRTIGGRYRITSALSQGGMGAVYLAQQISLGRDVALKVMLERGQDPELIKRFDIEARQVCLLKHPNIITYHDYGRDEDGHPYLVMEFLAGYPGTKLVYGERRTSLKDLLHVVEQVCSALHEAHQKGIIHRDLKWSNVMVCPQSHDPFFAKLIDFGIMKVATDGSSGDQRQLTVTGMLLGTPEYMSPEAICGMPIDGRADQYSLAVMLWEALEGRRPFTGATQFELLRQQVQEAPPPFSAARSLIEAHPRLEEVIQRAMEKHPDDRFAHILEFRAELLAAASSPGSHRALPPIANRRASSDIRPHTAQPIPKSQRLAASSPPGLPASAGVASAAGDAPHSVDTAHKTGRERRATRARWPLLVGAAVVLLGAGAAVALVVTSNGKTSTAAPTSAVATNEMPDASPSSAALAAATGSLPSLSASSTADTSAAEIVPAAAGTTAMISTTPPRPEDVVAAPPDAGPAPIEDAATPPLEDVPAMVTDVAVQVDARKPVDAKPAAPQGVGTLVVQAQPTAEVWINGKPFGTTPVVTDLKAGTATVVLEYAYGAADKRKKTRTAKIKPDETTKIIVDMRAD